MEDPSAAVAVGLEEQRVAEEVLVEEHDARWSGVHASGIAPYMLCARVSTSPESRLQRSALMMDSWRDSAAVRNARVRIDADEVRASAVESIGGKGFGEPAVDRDEERLVVLVPIVVDHYEDPPEVGEHKERVALDQLRVLQRELRRQERFRNTALLVHRVHAEPAREVGEEVEPAVRQLRL